MELDLIDEATLESLIKIGGQVGGRYEDAVKVLQLLQNDVLHGVVHLIDRIFHVLSTLVDNTISFVKEKNRHNLAMFTQRTIASKHLFDIFLTLTNPLVTKSSNINLHQVTTCLTSNLIDRLCLTSTRSPIEQTGKTFMHAKLCESYLDRW